MPSCVTEGGNYSLAVIYSGPEAQSYQQRYNLHIRVGTDQKFYPFTGFSTYDVLFAPEDAHGLVAIKHEGYNYGSYYQRYDNVISRLTRTIIDAGGKTITGYVFRESDPDHTIKAADGYKYRFVTYALSQNGRYFYGQADGQGAVLINTTEKTAKKVSRNYRGQYAGMSDSAGVSDTGEHAVAASYGSGSGSMVIYKFSDNCGTFDINTTQVYTPCPQENLHGDLKRTLDAQSNQILVRDIQFLDDYSLELTAGTDGYWRVKLEAGGYVPPERLEYLALGDSYSSGEGDITNQCLFFRL